MGTWYTGPVLKTVIGNAITLILGFILFLGFLWLSWWTGMEL